MKITPLPNIPCVFFWSLLPLAPGRKGISTTWTLKGFRPGKTPRKKPGIYREFVEIYGSLWWIYGEFIGNVYMVYGIYEVLMGEFVEMYVEFTVWRALRELSQTQICWIDGKLKGKPSTTKQSKKNIRRIYFAHDVSERVKHIPPWKTDDLLQ